MVTPPMIANKCPVCGKMMECDRDLVYHCPDCNKDFQPSRRGALIRITLRIIASVSVTVLSIYLPMITFKDSSKLRTLMEMALFLLGWYCFQKDFDYLDRKQELKEVSDNNPKYQGRTFDLSELLIAIPVAIVICLTVFN